MRALICMLGAVALTVGCTDPPAEPMGPPDPVDGPDGGAGGVGGDGMGGVGGDGMGGVGGDGMGGTGGEADPPAEPGRDAFGRCLAPSQPLRRLTQAQYENTVRDLVTMAIGEEFVDDLTWWLGDVLAALPPDEPTGDVGEQRGGFRRLDQVVYDEHVEHHARVAQTLAGSLAQQWIYRQLVGDCDATADRACRRRLITDLGALVHRRPLLDDDVDFYLGIYDGAPPGNPFEALRTAIASLLASPFFLYQVEPHGEVVDPERLLVGLDAWSVASRLSYHFWQSMPDAELFAAAADGSLLTEDGFAAQVERLYADPKAERALRAFFTEWLRADEIPDPTQFRGTPVFDAFAGGEEAVPNDLRHHAIDELARLGLYYTRTAPGGFSDLFASNLVFTDDPVLAGLYGTGPWQGGAPPEMPDAARAGLITRVALLISGSANSRPILKGVRIREAILCDRLAPPPPDAMVREPELAPDATSREVVEAITEAPGSSCAGCHLTQINPLGFATEEFDALGRFRGEGQRLFDDHGNLLGVRPVRTDTVPYVVPGDDTPVADAGALRDLILESGRAHDCFARQYVRFTAGRPDDGADAELLADLSRQLRDEAPLSTVMTAIAHHPTFRQRRTCVEGE